MRLHWFFKSSTLIFVIFFVFRFISKNDQPLQIPFHRIERKAIKLSSMYQPDCLDVNTKICPNLGQELDLFIAVLSAPDRVKQREAVRATWGHFSMRRDVVIAFIIGESSDIYWINKLDKEEEIYEDIIRCPLLDEPEVPTLKVMQILEWSKKYCRKAKFLLKTTDEVFINVSKLLLIMQKLDHKKKNIYGRLARMWTPSRNVYHANSVSLDEYGDSFFPDYTIGPSFLIPMYLCEELFFGSLRHNFLRSDDVFFTGIVAESLGIKRIHIEPFVNARLTVNTCNVRKAVSLKCARPIEQFDFWVNIHDLDVKCEKNRSSSGTRRSHDYIDPSSSPKDLEKIYVMTF